MANPRIVKWWSGALSLGQGNEFLRLGRNKPNPQIPMALEPEILPEATVFREGLLTPAYKRRQARVDVFPNLLLSTLFATQAPAPPFVPTEDCQPREHVARAAQDFQPPNLLLSTLQRNTPDLALQTVSSEGVRPRRRAIADQPPNLLLSSLTVVATSAPFEPVETSQARLHALRPQDPGNVPNLLLSALYVLPGDIVFREGLATPTLSHKHHVPPFEPPNLLLSTLAIAAPAPAPFAPVDTTQARAHVARPQDLAVPNILLGTLQTNTPDLALQTSSAEWVRPRRRGGLDQPPNLLTSTLVVAAGPAPFVPPETAQARLHVLRPQDPGNVPNLLLSALYVLPGDIVFREGLATPTLSHKHHIPPFEPPNLLLSTLAIAAPAVPPFTWVDFPQLGKRRSSQAPQTNVVYEADNVPPPPFISEELPQPRQRPGRTQSEIPPNLLITTLVAPTSPPFFSEELPQPRQHVARLQTDHPPNLLAGVFTALVPPAPFLGLELPQPRQHVARLQTDHPPNLLTGTFVAFVPPAPFVPPETAQARQRVARPVLEHPQNRLLDLLNAPAVGAEASPWQVPRRRRGYTFESPNLLTSTLAVIYDPLPFTQRYWEVPRARRRTPDSWFAGVNPLIPNVMAPVPPPLEQPDACRFRVDLGPESFEVDLEDVFEVTAGVTVYTIAGCEHGGGCMACKNRDYAIAECVKHPETDRRVELNFYRDCINFRKPNRQYTVGTFVRPQTGNGFAYEVMQGGTTAEREPHWLTEIGSLFWDGSVQFACRAAGVNAVNPISSPTADVTPATTPALTVVSPAIAADGWTLVATYSGGVLGRDYEVEWAVSLGGRSVHVTQPVKIRIT